jgi:hypothetical protein
MDDNLVMERGFLTERMDDEEIESLEEAVELYMKHKYESSDYVIAMRIGQDAWKSVWKYREHVEDCDGGGLGECQTGF